MIRMLIVGYVFAIRSERRLCSEVQVNLAYRWFCKLGIEDKIPDHSVFCRARHERFRESDALRHVFEGVARAELKTSSMPWYTLTLSERQFAKLRRDLKQAYQGEIAAGRVAGYVLFARKVSADFLLFIPPGAVVLFERTPRWAERLQPYRGTPALKGVEVIPVG